MKDKNYKDMNQIRVAQLKVIIM